MRFLKFHVRERTKPCKFSARFLASNGLQKSARFLALIGLQKSCQNVSGPGAVPRPIKVRCLVERAAAQKCQQIWRGVGVCRSWLERNHAPPAQIARNRGGGSAVRPLAASWGVSGAARAILLADWGTRGGCAGDSGSIMGNSGSSAGSSGGSCGRPRARFGGRRVLSLRPTWGLWRRFGGSFGESCGSLAAAIPGRG